jgi:PAS domain-containing protein
MTPVPTVNSIPLAEGCESRDALRVRRGPAGHHELAMAVLEIGPAYERSIIGASKIARDISERKRAEEALRQSHEQLHIALTASDTGTFRWNPYTGEFLTFDENLKRLFDFASGEGVRVTEDFISRVHPDDAPRLVAAINHCREGADFEQEYRVIHPDGSIHWLYGRAKMETDAEDNPTYLVGACTDITQRTQSEYAARQTAQRFLFMAETIGAIHTNPILGGLHHQYARI